MRTVAIFHKGHKYNIVDVTYRDNPYEDAGTGAFIYIVGFGDLYKIGIAKHLAERVYKAQVKQGRCYDFLHFFPADNARHAERALHRHFGASRVEGEWFRIPLTDIKAIRTIHKYENGKLR